MGIRAGEGVTLAGSALSDTRLSIDAARELRLDSALAYGGTLRLAGNDVLLGAASKTQGRGIDITATRDLRASGSTVSAGAAQLKAGRDAALSGTLAADGDLRLQAGGAASSDGQLSSTGKLQLQAGSDATLKGSLRSNGDLTADAGGKLALLGSASATRRVGSDLGGRPVHRQERHGPSGRRHRPAHARQLTTAGAMASLQALTISAAGDAIDGKLLAGGRCPSMRSARSRPARTRSCRQGALRLDAGRDLTLAGLAETTRHDAGLGRGPARGRQRHGLWRRAVVDGGPGLTLGATGNLQASGLLQARPAASCKRTARSRVNRTFACRPMPTPW